MAMAVDKSLASVADAIAFQLRTTKLREQHLGPTHPTVAIGYSNIGSIHESQGNLDSALENYMKVCYPHANHDRRTLI